MSANGRRHAVAMAVRRRDGARQPAPAPALAALVAAAMLSACQSAPPGPGPLALGAGERALPVMERIALAASRCWFKSGDPAFSAYRLAPELDSFSGRPRILLVARERPEDRPLGVIVAEGDPARIEAFGPVMAAPLGNRIAADLRRWTAGSNGCEAAA